MTTIVHATPGLIDVRAFTLMGVSAKPNSRHPIGMFGTGLKYAIATLVRLGADVDIWIGLDRYQFTTAKEDFRGQEVQRIVFFRTRWGGLRRTRHVLPFTTSYGRFWVPWMALRELHSNTLDEAGETLAFPAEDGEMPVTPTASSTLIVVRHPDYAAAWEKVHEVFHPKASAQLTNRADGVEALENEDPENSRLYYRGLRVFDLPKPSLYTYNLVTEMHLTEDRTLANAYTARAVLARTVLGSENEDFIHRILTAGEDHWEHELEFPSYISPGEAFRRVMAREDRRKYSRTSAAYWQGYAPREPRARRARSSVWDDYKGPWLVEGELVLAEGGTEVFRRPEGMDEDEWAEVAAAIVERCGMKARPPEPVVEPGTPTVSPEAEREEIPF